MLIYFFFFFGSKCATELHPGIIIGGAAHYENLPIQIQMYTEKLITEKFKIFRQKIQIFFVFLLKI